MGPPTRIAKDQLPLMEGAALRNADWFDDQVGEEISSPNADSAPSGAIVTTRGLKIGLIWVWCSTLDYGAVFSVLSNSEE
jgi:hypothetical protein